jgi:hypothetical protein
MLFSMRIENPVFNLLPTFNEKSGVGCAAIEEVQTGVIDTP